MVAVSAKEVKSLRDATGAGMMDCKKALVDNEGDLEAAMEFLRKKGLASAEKKASRAAKEGIIETYIHTGAKLGVMVEVNCETDFVAKRPEFQELSKAIAMQIAASPTVEVVSEADISADFIEREKKIEAQAEDLAGKPENIVDKIVTGARARAVVLRSCTPLVCWIGATRQHLPCSPMYSLVYVSPVQAASRRSSRRSSSSSSRTSATRT